jgi:uncharacterized RDD family membrane protein YckC
MNTNSTFPTVSPKCPGGFTLASKRRRLGTFIVDVFGYLFMCLIVGFLAGFIFGRAAAEFLNAAPQLFGILMFISYYILLESLSQRTLGKIAFGTIVVNEVGEKPTFRQVVIRSVSRFIPFEAISCFGERGWHDSLSKTHVVLKSSKPIG